jgi:signal transduction histidine kinase
MSVERKLPLLMTAVLAIVIAVAVSITYRTLRESAEASARERMTRGTESIAQTIDQTLGDRLPRLREYARGPLLAALKSRDSSRIARVLAESPGPADAFPVELWDPNGVHLSSAGQPIGAEERTKAFGAFLAEHPLSEIVRDSGTFTTLYPHGDRVNFWIIAPIQDGKRTLGFIAHRRRLTGTPAMIASLTALVGNDAVLYVRNRSNPTFWVRLMTGSAVPTPVRRDSTGGAAYDFLTDGTKALTTEAGLKEFPWIAALQAPRAQILAQSRAVVLRLTLLGAALTAISALLAWVISQNITRPLASLGRAVKAVAQGDYSRRAVVRGGDEVGRVAATFNRMAEEISATHRELEQRTQDAESARAESERANRAKADFLAVMSHELRTPLNAISGYTELLGIGVYGQLNTQQQDALKRIANNEQHITMLLKELLNFARIDAGQVEYDMTDVSVNKALFSVEPLIAPQLRAKSIGFDSPVCDASLTVRADVAKLQQVLLNLLGNSIKFTPERGGISIAVEHDAERVRILVRDTGMGIPADRLATIFNPFDRGDRALSKPHEGVGLGLAIARDLARGMGGDLTVTSEMGKGSVFTVTLLRTGNGAAPAPIATAAAVAS